MALFRPETATGTSSYAGTAETASYALTASYITASGVFGPFGSNSILSASYASTASYALNAGTPGGSDTQIQFNSASTFSGSTNLTFNYVNNTILLTGSISASYGASTVGFFGTASWAVSASRAQSASRADSAAVADALLPGASVPAAPPEYAVQFNSGSYLSGSEHFLYRYPTHSLEQGLYVTASGLWSHAQGRSTYTTGSFSHAEGMADAQFESQTSIIFSTVLNASVNIGDTTIKLKQDPGNIAGGTIRIYNDAGGYYDYTVSSGATYNAGTATYDIVITIPAVEKATAGNTAQVVSVVNVWVQNYNKAHAPGSHVEGYRTETYLSQSHAEGSGSITGKLGSAPIPGLYDTDFDGYTDFQIILGAGPNPSSYFLPGKPLLYDDTVYGGTLGIRVLTIRNATVSSYGIASWLISVSINESISYYNYWLLGIPGLPAIISDLYFGKSTLIINQGRYSHAEGSNTSAMGSAAHAEGFNTDALGLGSHAEGEFTLSIGTGSHTEGYGTKTPGNYSHAEGGYTTALGTYSHAEGQGTRAQGSSSHAEGQYTLAEGTVSHAEGYFTTASGNYSHAEGELSYAGGIGSHAEGYQTYVTPGGKGDYAHAEGAYTSASGAGSHAEGYESIAHGFASHAGGLHTIASASYTTTVGRYNNHNNTTALFTIGDGVSNGSRHDLLNAGIGYMQVSGSAVVSSSLEVIGLATVTGSAIVSSSLTTIGTNTTTGSAIVSSSLNVIGVSSVTGSNNITGSWTLIGAGQVTGSLDITGSYSLIGAGVVTGSLRVTGSLVANYANLTGSLTGSFFGTGSGDFDGQFIGRFTGSATGSFIGTGSGNFDGRFIGSFTGSATGSFIGTSSGHFDGIFTGSNSNAVSFYGTSSWAVSASYITGSVFDSTNPVLSASYAESSSYALSASYSVTSSYAESASYSLSSSYSVTSSYAESASYALSASYSVTSSYAESASYALSSSYSVTSSYAESASYSLSSSYSVTSSYAESSSYALSASYSVTSSHAVSALTTASVSPNPNDITFTRGDGTQFTITIDTGSGGSGDFVPSSWTGSATSYFAGTASYATYSLSSSFAETASAINVKLSSNTDERLPVILAYTSSDTGAKLAYIDAGFDYNTSTNALYLPSAGAVIIGNTTLQGSAATFGSATAQNHVVRITGSLNVSKSVNVDGAISASFGANTVGFFGTASWAVSASQALTASFASGAFIQNGNSFGATATLGTNDNQDLILETDGVQRIFISSSGQTWLGSAPSQQFSGTNAPIQLYGGTGTNNGIGIRGQVIYFYPAGTQTTASLQYGSAGLAAWQLRNLGTQAFQIRSTPGGGSNTTIIHLASGSSNDHRIGILTETPQNTLDVSGSARITGSFYLPGVTSSPYNNVLIIDTGSGQVYVTASSAIGGGGVPGGALRSIQFNSASVFSGSNNFTFNENTNRLDLTGSLVVSGGFYATSTAIEGGEIDLNNSVLRAANGNVILDWYNTLIKDYQGDVVLNIGARTLVWDNGSTAINFGTDNEVVVNGDIYLDDLTAATPASDADDVVLINSVTGQLYYTASTALVVPGGTPRSIQFNSASAFSGSSNFTFDETTNSVFVTGSLTISGSSTFTNIGPAVFSGSVDISGSTVISGSLNIAGAISASSNIEAAGDLKSNFSSGDEGGQIFLNKPVSSTTINTGVNIDVYKNQVRVFESGGTNRGAFIPLTSLSAGVSYDLTKISRFYSTTDGAQVTNVANVSSPSASYAVEVPGNTFTSGDIISVKAFAHHSPTAAPAGRRLFVHINTVPDFTGTPTLIGQTTTVTPSAGTSGVQGIERHFAIRNNTTSTITWQSAGNSDIANIGASTGSVAIDWTTTQYILIGIAAADVSAVGTGIAYSIQKL